MWSDAASYHHPQAVHFPFDELHKARQPFRRGLGTRSSLLGAVAQNGGRTSFICHKLRKRGVSLSSSPNGEWKRRALHGPEKAPHGHGKSCITVARNAQKLHLASGIDTAYYPCGGWVAFEMRAVWHASMVRQIIRVHELAPTCRFRWDPEALLHLFRHVFSLRGGLKSSETQRDEIANVPDACDPVCELDR